MHWNNSKEVLKELSTQQAPWTRMTFLLQTPTMTWEKHCKKRETFLVLGEDGKWHKADLYRVIDPKGPFPPARSYVEIMLSGARDLELDPEYIKKIEEYYRQSKYLQRMYGVYRGL